MRFTAALLLPALVVAVPLTGPGFGEHAISGDAPNPKEIQFTTAKTSGAGCPQGSVTTTFSPDMTVS
jgi:hypothetical protein